VVHKRVPMSPNEVSFDQDDGSAVGGWTGLQAADQLGGADGTRLQRPATRCRSAVPVSLDPWDVDPLAGQAVERPVIGPRVHSLLPGIPKIGHLTAVS
jgi:hypothetical protein